MKKEAEESSEASETRLSIELVQLGYEKADEGSEEVGNEHVVS